MKDGKRGDAMFGAIYGDVIGSYYEVHCTKAYDFPLMAESSFTDDSVPPALIAFLESSDYESAIRGAISLGGDADTQACIAGGIAEAYYGEIPDSIRQFCSMKIDFSIKSAVRDFCAAYKL